MSASANHHFIPKAILRRFCFSGNQVYYFSKSSNRAIVEPRNIESIFKKRHLNSYTMEDGTKDDGLEQFFAYNFDARIGSVIDYAELCSKNEKVFSFSEDEILFLVQFIYNHIKRSPDFHQPIIDEISREDFFVQAVAEFETKYGVLSPEKHDNITSVESRKRIIDQSRVINLSRQSTEILDRLAKMLPVMATPKSRKDQFIIGSNPVVRFSNSIGDNLDDDHVELWTTLTPRVAVGLVKHETSLMPLRLDRKDVVKINKEIEKHSNSIAAASKELLKKLSKA